jgi:hypothetical protein
MDKANTRPGVVLGAAAFLALAAAGGWLVLTAAMAPGAVVDSTTGSAGITVEGGKVSYSFTAAEDGNGAETGRIRARNHVIGIRLNVDVDCLRVTGNEAVMSGTVERVRDPRGVVQEGWFSIFAVQDNGEGVNDPPDLTSNLLSRASPAWDCESQDPPGGFSFNVDRGNIQVRDG